MKRRLLILLGALLATTVAARAEAGWLFGKATSNCGESCGSPTCGCPADGGMQYRSHGCMPGDCHNCDNECDCDRECCEHCGKKKPKKRKKCCLFTCLSCGEPPRAESAFSMPARIDLNAPEESDSQRESGKADPESAAAGKARIDAVEKDLTRLTLVVEQMAKGQQQQQEDLTKATLILERIAKKVGP